MKPIFSIAIALFATSTIAQTHVDGHFRRDGTYVPPHYRSTPNDSRIDNYSTRGNSNPFTGERGTTDPYAPRQPGFGSPSRSTDSFPIEPIQPITPLAPLSPYGTRRR